MAEAAVLRRENMAEAAVLEYENMAEDDGTVWIGFMDIVPVIGAVKESVELVLAVYEGNEAVIKEKVKALENFVNAPFQKHLTQTQYKPAGDAAEFSGLVNVRGVPMRQLAEHVKKGSKNQNLTSGEQNKRERQLEKIRNDTITKLNSIGVSYGELKEELKEELSRSKRGEHVFNNDILKFHEKVLKDFIKENRIKLLVGYNSIQQTMDELGKHTLSKKTADDIQNNMKAYFEPNEFYVNSNAILYGKFSEVLREAFLKVMRHINPDDKKDEETQRVTLIINEMNKHQIYVDQFAKVKWIEDSSNNEQKNKKQRRFEEVRGQVANMYREERGLDWCTDIMSEVAPLFNQRQIRA